MSLPRYPGTGPDRQRQGTMGHKVEAGTECIRHQLRRKSQLNADCGSTENRTVPGSALVSVLPDRAAGQGCRTGAPDRAAGRAMWLKCGRAPTMAGWGSRPFF